MDRTLEPISITGLGAFSMLGTDFESVCRAYAEPGHCLSRRQIGKEAVWAGAIPEGLRERLDRLKQERSDYRQLDDSVLFAILASREAIKAAGWGKGDDLGINIGSSRGATGHTEAYHREFLETGRVPSLASPGSTLGNISSWVAQDLGSRGPELSHSITCSTALHAVLNAMAWLRSGMAERMLAGGSEAPLTPFTVAQMQALRIYSRETGEYPCRALDPTMDKNSLVLGEGAASACLEPGVGDRTLAVIRGAGYATEPLTHAVSLSAQASCLQASMKMAIGSISPSEVDAVVMHAPGTIKGDRAERNAVRHVFGEAKPVLTTTKWKTGHSFGASGMFSLELAVCMLQSRRPILPPYLRQESGSGPIRRVLVNAVGFGGNAVSILLEGPED